MPQNPRQSSDPEIDRVLSGYVKKKVREEATRQGVPEDFADRMASAESAYKPDVIKGQRKSRVGAQGPMQLMPGTARDLKVDPDHINQNIEGGVRYAKQQLDAFGGDQRKASAAYNWGPGNVRKFGTDRAPAETRAYMDKVGGDSSSADPEIEALLQAYQARKTTPQPQRNASPGVFKQRPQAPNAGRKLAENLLDFRSGQNAPMAQAARLDAAIAPEVKQQRETRDARMRKSREEYDRKSFLGRRASDVASGLENIGQSGQRAFENALTFSGVRDVLEMNDTAKNALAEGKAAQQYTAQKMQEEQAARNAMASQVTRGLTQGAGGAAIMAPLAMTGGVPALMAGTGLQQDWENDPKGALLNTATAGVPVLAGKAISPVAGRIAGAVRPALQRPVQMGIEAGAGGLANVGQYAGTQAALGREINPEEALVQGITGAGLSGVMAPKLADVQAQNQARQALRDIPRETPAPMNLRPTAVGPTERVRVTPGDFQRANLETQKGFTQPLTEPLAPTPQVVPAAPVTPDAAPAVAGMPNRADFEPGFLGDVEYQGALANAQRVAKPAKAAAAKPAYDPAAFRGAIDDAKIQAGEAEAAGNWESARDQYKSAMDTITEMQKEARRNRDAAALSELAREKSATNTNWQVAKRNAERAAKMPAPKAPEAARQMPQVQQAQQIASGAKSSLGNAEKPLSQVNLQETAPTRDLSAPLPTPADIVPRTTAEIPRVQPKISKPDSKFSNPPESQNFKNQNEILTPQTNRITEGAGDELPRRGSRPLADRPNTEPLTATLIDNSEVRRRKQEIGKLIPFNIQGNKADLLAKGLGNLIERAAKGTKRTIDAFAGSGTYTHYLRSKGHAREGDILNEYEPLRHIAHKQIRDNPEAVGKEAERTLNDLRGLTANIREGETFAETHNEIRRQVTQYFRDRMSKLAAQGQDLDAKRQSGEPVEMQDSPETAGLYTIMQNQAFNFLPIQAEMGGKGFKLPGFGVVGNVQGKVGVFIKSKNQTFSTPQRTLEAGPRMKGVDVRRGDGWELIGKEAGEGDLVPVDTSYLNKGDATTSNYNKATQEDATPSVYIEKVRKYLLPAWDRGAKLIITNNWDEGVANYLRSEGFTVLKANRQGASVNEVRQGGAAELIAINFDKRSGQIKPRGNALSGEPAGRVSETTQQSGSGDAGKTASAPLDDRTASQDEAIRGRGNVRELEVSPAEAALREREALPPIERRRALRDATYKGQFGKLSEAARKRGDRETSLAENPQLRRLLDLPEMPPYRLPDAPINPKTGEPYVNPAWTEAAQDTLNALAAVAGKERSSQINFGPGELSGGQQPSLAGKINPQTGKPYVYNIPPKGQPTRGEAGDLFLAVQELARKRGEQIDPSLRAAFKGTVEGARTAKAGYEAFVVDERLDDIENSLREIYRRGKLSSKDNTAHRDAFREIAAEYGVSTARADANFAGIKAQAASRAQRAGEAQPAGEDQGRSEGRSRPVVGAVEQRATGTDGRSAEGGGRAAVQKAKPVEKPARPAKSTEQQLADVDKMLAMDAITEKAAASMKERIRAAAKRASFGPLENEPSGPVATMFGGQKILDNLRAGRRPVVPKTIPANFNAQAWVRKAAENLAKQTLSDADKAKVADPNTTAAEKAKIYAAAKPDPARETAFRTTMGEAFAALSANDYNGFQDAANRLKAISDAPATNWEKATAIRKAAMLSRPVSHLRNLIGNTAFQNLEEVARIPGSMGDAMLGAVTGRRTLQGASVEDSARAIYEAATGGITSAKDAMAGRSNEEIAKALQTREVNFNNKVVDKAVKFVFRSLGAEDQIFYTGAYDRAIREAAKLTARNEARQGVINRADIKKRQDALLAAPTPAMEVDATLAAETAVFRNSNKLSEGIAGFRDKIGDKGNFALDLVLPFDKTPTNVVFRALEYSPLGVARGAVKGVAGAARAIGARRTANKNGAPSKADVQAAIDKAFTPAQQRSAAQLLGRGTVGTGLLALGYALASKGMMTGFYDDEDYKGEAMKRATGAQPLAIKIKDRWYGLQGIGPIGMALGMGATMQQEANKKGGDIYGGAAKAAKEQVLETPLLSSMKDLSKDVERVSKDRANAGKLVGNLASSFVPGVLTDIEPFVSPLAPDQFEREVKDDPKKVKGMRRALREGGGQVAAKIPGVRRLLPVKRDITGKPVPSRPLQAIDPFSSRPATGRLPVKRR